MCRWTILKVRRVFGERTECRIIGQELFGVTKGMDERMDESVLRWFSHTEIIVKMIYVGGVWELDLRRGGLIK